MREAQVQSLGWEDPLEKGMATHSSIFAWEIYGQRSLAGYSLRGCKESDMTEQLTHKRSSNNRKWCPAFWSICPLVLGWGSDSEPPVFSVSMMLCRMWLASPYVACFSISNLKNFMMNLQFSHSGKSIFLFICQVILIGLIYQSYSSSKCSEKVIEPVDRWT